jgi:diguanylate cyclase (GGDEF)-like protein
LDVEGEVRYASGMLSGRRLRTVLSSCLAVVLLGLSGVATWSSFATSAAAQSSQREAAVDDAYSAARFWVGAEESLERKYRLEPGPQVRQAHAAARAAVDTAMAAVAERGTAADRVVAADVRRRNAGYAQATQRLFEAADRGDVRAELEIDHGVADPVFTTMQDTVYAQADRHARLDAAAGRSLLQIETIARWATSCAVGVGLLLIVLFAQLRRSYGRENAEQGRRNAHQVTHDALTGLPNRLQFARALDQELVAVRQAGGSVGVVLLDLDRFKEVNDTLGHQIGDRLLQQVGPRLGEVLGTGEVMARLGGDEFALLITARTSGEEAVAEQRAVVHRVLAAFDAPFVIDDITLAVEATAGLASYPQHGDTGEVLLQRADIAMYLAKGNHESVAVYDRTLDSHNRRKLMLLADLRQAVDREELVLHYQPLIDIATHRVRGVEALVRWRYRDEGLLPPADFVQLAESSGFIHELTRYVLTRAVRDAKGWAEAGLALTVSVNISARCLLDSGLPEAVASTLAAVGLPAQLVTLEITESAIIADPFRAQDVINRLHTLGVALSIDDFGTGYTSLAYLRDLPIQELKIDRSFITRMLHSPKDAVIVRTVIELAQRLGLECVGEGVEDAAVLSALDALGCSTAQGYHLSKPLPEYDLGRWIDAWNSTHHHVPSPRTASSTANSTANRTQTR